MGDKGVIVSSIAKIILKCGVIEVDANHAQIIVGGVNIKFKKVPNIGFKVGCSNTPRLIDQKINRLKFITFNRNRINQITSM